MSSITPRWGLTRLVEGQSGAENVVNTNDNIVDALLHAMMLGWATNTPPGSPAQGDCYLVGSSPTGAWATGFANKIAAYYGTAWIAITPRKGMVVWDDSTTSQRWYDGSAWNYV